MLMKGIVLAGGSGSRLFPLTKITNKHLLPIYDRPMIYYPIQTLVDAGIEDIMVVTGGRNSGDFLRLLANGKEIRLKHIHYTYQESEGGIADALALKDNTQIRGGGSGTLTIESGGQLSVTTATGATLDGVIVTDTNAGGTNPGIDVVTTLTLNDGTQILGGGTGTMTIESGGELLIAAGSGQDVAALRGATLDGVIVTDNSGFLAGDVGG